MAVGITTLDYDHTKILGETIEEIAWHKAGIMKEGTVAFVNPYQPEVNTLITDFNFKNFVKLISWKISYIKLLVTHYFVCRLH